MTAASVAALRNAKTFAKIGGSTHLLFPELNGKKIEGDYNLEMLMLDG